MKIDLDETTVAALKAAGSRMAGLTGMKPRSPSLLSQALLQWACETVPDSELKALGPKAASSAQRRKAVLRELRTLTGQVDAEKLDKLMRTIQRMKNSEEKDSDKEPETSALGSAE